MKIPIYLSLITLSVSVFFSCNKEEKNYTPQELQHKTDSILTIEIKVLQRQAKEDLDRRLPIELKPKVDSILKVSYEVPLPPEIEGGTNAMGDTFVAPQAEKKQRTTPLIQPKNLPALSHKPRNDS